MLKRSVILSFFLAFFSILGLPTIVSADMGPKPNLTVYVTNPPGELYYLDLLVQYRGFDPNIDIESYNQEMLALLFSCEGEGWIPRLTAGGGAPLWGSLTGRTSGSRMVHEFGYFGLPDTYRIIIVTESGSVTVSDVLTRIALQSSITYDYESGKAVAPSVVFAYAAQFATTFLLTVLLEGAVLILFRISLKRNWKVFLLANFITQVALTLTVGIALVKSGTIIVLFIQFPVEIIIIAVETVLFAYLFTGVSKRRIIGYGITANITSWIAGLCMLHFSFLLLNNML